ncbi:hypothetical protein [Microbacterium testaceum]|uniref:hypothetical protein n=1 Tax=Microbacterium testaceum TaxID=2033 RepID=UPI001FA7C860|nr:hypothetical protein [Microbacterium testaceum]
MGLSDLGDAVNWGEACVLVKRAALDPSTALGAELAGWAYPASMPELLTLLAQIPSRNTAKAVMPWSMKVPDEQTPATPDEIASADAALESEFVFT